MDIRIRRNHERAQQLQSIALVVSLSMLVDSIDWRNPAASQLPPSNLPAASSILESGLMGKRQRKGKEWGKERAEIARENDVNDLMTTPDQNCITFNVRYIFDLRYRLKKGTENALLYKYKTFR